MLIFLKLFDISPSICAMQAKDETYNPTQGKPGKVRERKSETRGNSGKAREAWGKGK
jgi:hypothetical protein